MSALAASNECTQSEKVKQLRKEIRECETLLRSQEAMAEQGIGLRLPKDGFDMLRNCIEDKKEELKKVKEAMSLATSNECTLVTQSEVDDTVPVAVVPVVYSSDSDAPTDSAAGAPASSASKKRSVEEPAAEEGNKKARTRKVLDYLNMEAPPTTKRPLCKAMHNILRIFEARKDVSVLQRTTFRHVVCYKETGKDPEQRLSIAMFDIGYTRKELDGHSLPEIVSELLGR